MAIGSFGVAKKAAKGGIVTLCITVPLTVAECYLKDQTAWYQLTGNIGAELVKVLEELPEKGEKAAVTAGEGFWSFMRMNGYGMGNWLNDPH